MREFLWYNCSAVCGLSAQRLNGGINGDLLQEGSCHRLGDPDLLQPEPLPLWQATADLYLYRRHSNTGLTQSLGSLGHGSHKVLFEPSKCLWRVWDLALNMILPLLPSCWGFSFALDVEYLLLVGSNILLLMVVQQWVVILDFSWEKMSACLLLHLYHLWYRKKQTYLISKNVLIVIVLILINKNVFEPSYDLKPWSETTITFSPT